MLPLGADCKHSWPSVATGLYMNTMADDSLPSYSTYGIKSWCKWLYWSYSYIKYYKLITTFICKRKKNNLKVSLSSKQTLVRLTRSKYLLKHITKVRESLINILLWKYGHRKLCLKFLENLFFLKKLFYFHIFSDKQTIKVLFIAFKQQAQLFNFVTCIWKCKRPYWFLLLFLLQCQFQLWFEMRIT